jgi:hypothetical protein
MIEVEAPDGTVVEFPQGTPPDVMTRAMQQRFGSPAQQAIAASAGLSQPPTPQSVAAAAASPAPPAERTWGDTAAGVAAQTMRGARRGVANIAGLPVDIVNAVMGFAGAPVSPTPFGGSRSIDAALGAPAQVAAAGLNAAGVPASAEIAPPANAAERVMGRIGEEVGAAVIPAGAALRAGGAGVQAVRAAGPTQTGLAQLFSAPVEAARTIGRGMAESAAVNPTRFATNEAAAAIAAGTGAGLVNELTGASTARERTTGQNLGDMAGAIGGVGALAAGRGLVGGAGSIAGALTGSPRFADEIVKANVADELLRHAATPPGPNGIIDSTPLVDAIMGGRRVGQSIPGFQETLGDRTGNAGLQALEFNTAGQRPGAFNARATANTQAVDAAMRPIEPQTPASALREEMLVERNRRLSDAEIQRLNAQDAFGDASQRVQPTMTGEARGADIRGALADAQTAARTQVDEAYRPINEADAPVDIGPLAQRFGELQQQTPLATQPAIPDAATVPQRLIPEGADSAQVPLREVMATRSALTSAERGAAATPGQEQAARLAGDFRGATDDFLDNAMPAELADQYRAANTARRDVADRFERPGDAVADVLRTRPGGDFATPDSGVARRFVQSDQQRISDFQALMREAGDNPRVVPAVRDEILQAVQSRRLLENPRQLEAYLGQYKTLLSDQRFADVRQELSTAAGLRRALDDATGAETRVQRQLGTDERPGSSPVGQFLRFGNERQAEAMRTVMASPNPAQAIDDVLRFVNDDPKAVDGARRAFWDAMQERSRRAGQTTQGADGTQPWMPERLHRFINDPANAAVAERLWRDNPEHLARIRELADVLRQTDTRQRGRAAGTSGTGQIMNQSIMPSTETLASRSFAIQRGVVGVPFTATTIGAVIARKAVARQQTQLFQTMIDEALMNPDWAAALLRENNPANRAALARSAKGWMGNQASTLAEILGPENETNDAIMRGSNVNR